MQHIKVKEVLNRPLKNAEGLWKVQVSYINDSGIEESTVLFFNTEEQSLKVKPAYIFSL